MTKSPKTKHISKAAAPGFLIVEPTHNMKDTGDDEIIIDCDNRNYNFLSDDAFDALCNNKNILPHCKTISNKTGENIKVFKKTKKNKKEMLGERSGKRSGERSGKRSGERSGERSNDNKKTKKKLRKN